MPLPSLEKIIPIFPITIPSLQETLQFRPFLVKEEKLLLIAMDGNDENQMLDAVGQVVANCAISPLKVDELANFDLEYVFLQLRARSVNESAELNYRCHNQLPVDPDEYMRKHRLTVLPDGPLTASCDHIVKIVVKLDAIKVVEKPGHTKTIMLTDTMGINMKYPSLAMSKKLLKQGKDKPSAADALTSVALCIESVFDESNVYSQFQPKEIIEWIEGLTQTQFAKIHDFFETMPKLQHDVQFVCPKCEYSEVIHLEGFASFFG